MSNVSRIPPSPHKSASSSHIIAAQPQSSETGPVLQHTNSEPSTANHGGRITSFLSESTKSHHHAASPSTSPVIPARDGIGLKSPSPRDGAGAEANGSGGRATPRHEGKAERHTPRDQHPGAHQKVLTPRKQGPIVDKAKSGSPDDPAPVAVAAAVAATNTALAAAGGSPSAAVSGAGGSRIRRGSLSLPSVTGAPAGPPPSGPLSPTKPPAAPPLQLATSATSDDLSTTSRSSVGGTKGKGRASQGLSLSTGASIGSLLVAGGSAGPASSRGAGDVDDGSSPRRGFASPLRRSIAPAARGVALQHELGLLAAFRARERDFSRQINANTPFQYLDASADELQRAAASPRGTSLLVLPSARPGGDAKPDATAFSKWHLEMDERVAQRKAQVLAALAQSRKTNGKYVSMPVQQRLSRRGLDQLAEQDKQAAPPITAANSGSNLSLPGTVGATNSNSSLAGNSRESTSGVAPEKDKSGSPAKKT